MKKLTLNELKDKVKMDSIHEPTESLVINTQTNTNNITDDESVSILDIIKSLFGLWLIIGIIPWAWMVQTDTTMWWILLVFQFIGMVGIITSFISSK